MNDAEQQQFDMLVRENSRLRHAGTKLARAAMRVVVEYDGLHRLALASAEWCDALAGEHDRPHGKKGKKNE